MSTLNMARMRYRKTRHCINYVSFYYCNIFNSKSTKILSISAGKKGYIYIYIAAIVFYKAYGCRPEGLTVHYRYLTTQYVGIIEPAISWGISLRQWTKLIYLSVAIFRAPRLMSEIESRYWGGSVKWLKNDVFLLERLAHAIPVYWLWPWTDLWGQIVVNQHHLFSGDGRKDPHASWRACSIWSVMPETAIELVPNKTRSPNVYVLRTADHLKLSPIARCIGSGSIASAEWGSPCDILGGLKMIGRRKAAKRVAKDC